MPRLQMEKPPRNILRELLEVGITLCLFLALVALYWVYVLVVFITAIYRSLVRRR
jgi:hypothetical protein